MMYHPEPIFDRFGVFFFLPVCYNKKRKGDAYEDLYAHFKSRL